LAQTYPRKFETSTLYTANHMSFHMFVLYLVKSSSDFYVYIPVWMLKA